MPSEEFRELDSVDMKILAALVRNGDLSLKHISDKARVSKSTVHNRLNKLRKSGVLKGFLPWLDFDKLGEPITAVSLIRARYGPDYQKIVGTKLATIKGVWAVYFVLGENDFIVLSRARTREQLEDTIQKFTEVEGVERSNTSFVLDVLKEDPRDAVRFD